MMFHSSLSEEHRVRYFRVIEEGIAVRTHADLLRWLQGEIQHYLPHEIMLAVWGGAAGSSLRHDLVSALPGVRTWHLQSEDLRALQRRFHDCWLGLGEVPFRLSLGAWDLHVDILEPLCAFCKAIHGMQSLLIHGIRDERGGQDCLYVIFSSADSLNSSTLAAMENLLPYLDAALRRVTLLVQQPDIVPSIADASIRSESYRLTAREAEIMRWVRIGKTNAQIASVLGISSFTVKNHMQRIFKKCGAYNRTQAAAKLGSVSQS